MILSTPDIILSGAGNRAEEITRCLQTLLGTMAGELQMDRAFGVSTEALDQPLPIAEAMISADIIEKVRKYEPRIAVEQVTFSGGVDGSLIPKVVCNLV